MSIDAVPNPNEVPENFELPEHFSADFLQKQLDLLYIIGDAIRGRIGMIPISDINKPGVAEFIQSIEAERKLLNNKVEALLEQLGEAQDRESTV